MVLEASGGLSWSHLGGMGWGQQGTGGTPEGTHTHLPLLTADLAQPDGLGPVVGGLHPALGAHILQAKQRAR